LNIFCDMYTKDIVSFLEGVVENPLYELIWLNILNVFDEQLKILKEYRTEFLNSETELQIQKMEASRHLDDFNNEENEDIALKWSKSVAVVNEQILIRLKLAKKLHPAVDKSPLMEQEHLRTAFKTLISLYYENNRKKAPSILKVFQIVTREWIVCQVVWPIIERLSSPVSLNSYIIEKVIR
jgi:hypothetical protein